MANLKPITVQNFIVTISGATGLTGTFTFSKCTAVRLSRTEASYNDGQTGQEHMTYGFSRREKISVAKAYDPVNDAALETWAQNMLEKPTENSDFTLTIQPVQSDIAGTPIASAKARVLTGCQIVSMRLPDVDRSGGSTAMMELEIYYQTATKS